MVQWPHYRQTKTLCTLESDKPLRAAASDPIMLLIQMVDRRHLQVAPICSLHSLPDGSPRTPGTAPTLPSPVWSENAKVFLWVRENWETVIQHSKWCVSVSLLITYLQCLSSYLHKLNRCPRQLPASRRMFLFLLSVNLNVFFVIYGTTELIQAQQRNMT